MSEIEKLNAEMDANKARRKRRSVANEKDWQEYCRLQQKLERAIAMTLKGKQVVLNPDCSIGHKDLVKLRGMTATVLAVGRKYIQLKFSNEEMWDVQFCQVVPATP